MFQHLSPDGHLINLSKSSSLIVMVVVALFGD